MRVFLIGVGIVLVGMLTASADSIFINGIQYTDVLVYESGEYFYVKIPNTGKSMSVSKAKVSSDQVKINDDPYYRDQLRNLYKSVKAGDAAAMKASKPVDSAFIDVVANKTIDTSALFSAGGGKPMNMSVDAAKAGASNAGVTLAQSGSGLKGSSEDGLLTVTVAISDGKVTGLTGVINSTDQQVVQGKMFPLIGLIAEVAPWVQTWILGNVSQLSTPGATIQETQDGVSIVVGVSASGLSFSVKGA
jgi:hypothetical protein